ncbi:hypothetical protein QBC44DRAFT_392820 [Cladorrhinum sp. PSN332]|nr:hypothetical protein QBC44DRAFT_392820 [Cladorrhinum sp. PSN332]
MVRHSPASGPSPFRFILLAVTLLSNLSTTLAADAVSVRDEKAFKAMRECARTCFVSNGSGDLIGQFGCRWPYQNDCLCRTDLAPAASKYLSTCCDAYCTVGPATGDISTVISLYNSYCVSNGYEVTAAVAAPAKTTAAAGPGQTPTKQGTANAANTATTGQIPGADRSDPTGTQAGSSSEPTSAAKSGGGGGGLSTGAMIGIIAPIVSVLLTGIGLLVKVYYNKKRVKQDQELQQKSSSEKLRSV